MAQETTQESDILTNQTSNYTFHQATGNRVIAGRHNSYLALSRTMNICFLVNNRAIYVVRHK